MVPNKGGKDETFWTCGVWYVVAFFLLSHHFYFQIKREENASVFTHTWIICTLNLFTRIKTTDKIENILIQIWCEFSYLKLAKNLLTLCCFNNKNINFASSFSLEQIKLQFFVIYIWLFCLRVKGLIIVFWICIRFYLPQN